MQYEYVCRNGNEQFQHLICCEFLCEYNVGFVTVYRKCFSMTQNTDLNVCHGRLHTLNIFMTEQVMGSLKFHTVLNRK